MAPSRIFLTSRRSMKISCLVLCSLYLNPLQSCPSIFYLVDIFFLFYEIFSAQQPNAVQGRLMLEVSQSRTINHHSRWDSSGQGISPSERHLPNNTQDSEETDIHAPNGIRTRYPSKQAAVDPRLRPPGYSHLLIL